MFSKGEQPCRKVLGTGLPHIQLVTDHSNGPDLHHSPGSGPESVQEVEVLVYL